MAGFNQGNLFGDGESSKPERKPQLPARRDVKPIVFNGVEIKPDEWGFGDLTAWWRANGSPPNKKPAAWMRLPSAVEFIESLARSLNVAREEIIFTSRGRGGQGGRGGTWAHDILVQEYGRYLNRNNQKKNESYVYFLLCTVTGLVKIGTTNDIEARISCLQCSSPTELKLIGTIPGGTLLEHKLHARYAAKRHHGEWFRLNQNSVRRMIRRITDSAVPPPSKYAAGQIVGEALAKHAAG